MRIHITGASGSGTTTLGAALAEELGLMHFDGDHYYWLPTTPPFQEKRLPLERFSMLQSDLQGTGNAVLSGSIVGWGQELEDAFDLIVFIYLPAAVRIERLQLREMQKYGKVDPAFLEWAALYDDGPPEGRSLAKHTAWLASRNCPILRLEANESVAQRVARVKQALPKNFSCSGRPSALRASGRR
jgi:hypothetical protein